MMSQSEAQTPQSSVAGVPVAATMATPEQKQQLQTMFGAVTQKMGDLKAQMFAASNTNEASRIATLKQVFAQLQASGVDLSDPQSVSDFMTKMQQTSPDMAALFEQSMNSLLGADGSNPSMGSMAPAGSAGRITPDIPSDPSQQPQSGDLAQQPQQTYPSQPPQPGQVPDGQMGMPGGMNSHQPQGGQLPVLGG